MTFGVIEKSCNKMIVDIVFWKNVCIPAILFGMHVMKLNQKHVNNLQITVNNVYRKILRTASYTPIGTLRGEVGSSL